jgi:thiol-disulfide isomerase/thioredoxin
MKDLYKKGELTEKDFCTDIMNCGDLSHSCKSGSCDHEAGLVLFYASWCPHCVNFVDKWKEVQARENSKIFFRSYNAANKPQFWAGKNNALVQGYPTIVKYKKKGKGKFAVAETFGGNRGDVDELVAFAMRGIVNVNANAGSTVYSNARAGGARKLPKAKKPAPKKARARSKSKPRSRARSKSRRRSRARSKSRK